MSTRRIGNYQITDYIGGGGFGSVYRAEDVNSPDRIVAIKELHKKHTRNPVIKQRFFQEAVAMARLDHPNLPRLFTFGEDNGCYYLVMEFLSGKLLNDAIAESGRIGADRAVQIISQVLDGVRYAHKNGIIHRDLKPDNIMLLEQNGQLVVKVLDFGIARMVGGENLTMTGQGFGTPAYMSPERITGASSNDPRIDIYSIGIILYEMLSGRTPFESTASDPVVYWTEMRALHETVPVPTLTNLGVSESLDQVVRRAAAKRVEDRYDSADEMLTDLSKRGLVSPQGATQMVNARLSLVTQPAGSHVYVDDQLHGVTDVRGRITLEGLTPGLHSVRVSKDGYNEYRISVALEQGKQTDLQVALAARSTVAVPPAASTAAGGFETVKFGSADEHKTAVVVLDSLPVGSNVFVGDRAVALAGEDGKATLQLAPGDHDIRVAAPSGAIARRRISLTNDDTAFQKQVTIPMDRTTSTPPQPARAVRRSGSPSGKRWAAAGVVVLLVALVASAAYVFVFQKSRTAAPPIADNQSAQIPQPPAPSSAENATPAKGSAESDELKKAREDAELAQAEKTRLEKKLSDEQKKQAAQSKEEPSQPAAPAVSPVTTPVAPQPQPAAANPGTESSEPAPAPGKACLMVSVASPTGEPGANLAVLLIEQPDSSQAVMFKGRTNLKGRHIQCGLTPNRAVRVTIFGPRGGLLGTKMTTVSPGRNFVDLTIVRPGMTQPAEDDPMQFRRGPRKRMFRKP